MRLSLNCIWIAGLILFLMAGNGMATLDNTVGNVIYYSNYKTVSQCGGQLFVSNYTFTLPLMYFDFNCRSTQPQIIRNSTPSFLPTQIWESTNTNEGTISYNNTTQKFELVYRGGAATPLAAIGNASSNTGRDSDWTKNPLNPIISNSNAALALPFEFINGSTNRYVYYLDVAHQKIKVVSRTENTIYNESQNITVLSLSAPSIGFGNMWVGYGIDGNLKMLYEWQDASYNFHVNLANGTNATTFTKYGGADVSLLDPSRATVGGPEVHIYNNTYYVFVHVADHGNTPTDVFVYNSTNLIPFTRIGSIMSRTYSFEKDQVADINFIEHNGSIIGVYEGVNTPNELMNMFYYPGNLSQFIQQKNVLNENTSNDIYGTIASGTWNASRGITEYNTAGSVTSNALLYVKNMPHITKNLTFSIQYMPIGVRPTSEVIFNSLYWTGSILDMQYGIGHYYGDDNITGAVKTTSGVVYIKSTLQRSTILNTKVNITLQYDGSYIYLLKDGVSIATPLAQTGDIITSSDTSKDEFSIGREGNVNYNAQLNGTVYSLWVESKYLNITQINNINSGNNYDIMNMSIIPSSDFITTNINIWNTTNNYYKKWNESSVNHSVKTQHIIGDFPANTQVQIKKNGVNWNNYTSNNTGYINFTYSDGYSEIQFEAETNYYDIISSSGDFIPPTPINCISSFLNSSFQITTTCSAGIGNVTDSMNKTDGFSWVNDTNFFVINNGMTSHSWSNITMYAYNTTGNDSLNLTPATLHTKLGNNVPILSSIGNKFVVVNNTRTYAFEWR